MLIKTQFYFRSKSICFDLVNIDKNFRLLNRYLAFWLKKRYYNVRVLITFFKASILSRLNVSL